MQQLRRSVTIEEPTPGFVGNPPQGYDTATDRCVARRLAFPILIATEPGYHQRCFLYGRRFLGGLVLRTVCDQSFLFVFRQKGSAWQFGNLPVNFGHIIDAPGNHHVHGQTGGQTIVGAELAFFDIAAAF